MLRRSLALVLLAVAGTGLSPAPAQAHTGTVVLTLRAADPAALAAAALQAPDDAQQRARRTSALTPPSTARRGVERWLSQRGFAVTTSTAWTITAHGPTHLVTGRRLPAALRPSVLSVVPQAAAPMRPRRVPAGFAPDALRRAYDVADGADGAGTTVATIQFSGWQEQDAQVFARASGIDLQPGQIRSQGVAGAPVDLADGQGGDFEVSLDVQAVLGAAPAARQRVFIAPNTTTGALAVYDAVATAAERTGLTAVSISWGACEQATSPQLVTALEQSLARMVAAGTTVFAASGDAGAYGCSSADRPDPRLAVDYPAASPSVLGVGGTSLRHDGSRWVEAAWTDRTGATGQHAGAGTGGGLSTLFAQPAWQRALPALRGQTRRAVPDVAAVADPATGIGVYGPAGDGRRGWLVGGGTSASAPLLAGQLASTVSAMDRTLGLGRLHVPLYAAARDGVGLRDVLRGDNLRHPAGPGYDLATGLGTPQWAALTPRLSTPALVAPAATSGSRVEVVPYAPVSAAARFGLAESAAAACAQDLPTLPTVLTLADGPDRATAAVLAVRVDGQCRTTTSPLVLDRTAPSSRAGLARSSRPHVLALTWSGEDPAPSSGVGAVTWRLRRTDTGAVVATATADRSGSVLRSVRPGADYVLEVETRDGVGLVSTTSSSRPVRVD